MANLGKHTFMHHLDDGLRRLSVQVALLLTTVWARTLYSFKCFLTCGMLQAFKPQKFQVFLDLKSPTRVRDLHV